MKPIKGVFITGTGTEVGKTFVSCAIARYWSDQGRRVGVMKPVASGGIRMEGVKTLVSEDAILLKSAARSDDPIQRINPVCYQHPLAPYTASFLEGNKLDVARIKKAYRELKSHDRILVEGVGGAAVPLDQKTDVADLIKTMNLPAIVVANSKLGTLNHTLLTLNYLKMKRVSFLGIILNQFDKKDLTHRTNLQFFQKKKIPVLATFPSDSRLLENFDLLSREASLHANLKKILR